MTVKTIEPILFLPDILPRFDLLQSFAPVPGFSVVDVWKANNLYVGLSIVRNRNELQIAAGGTADRANMAMDIRLFATSQRISPRLVV